MKELNTKERLQEEIINILKVKYPSYHAKSKSKLDWGKIEKDFKGQNSEKLFKDSSLRRNLGFSKVPINKGESVQIEILEQIKGIIQGKSKKEIDSITISSSGTSNFEGYYLMLSPSSKDDCLNLFPLEILSNGDFNLKHVNDDYIKGITSLNSNHLSFYANRIYSISESNNSFRFHSVFNVPANNRNDLAPFNLGVATRRGRKSSDLKAVIEILIKIDKNLYEAFMLKALTLERYIGGEGTSYHLQEATNTYLESEYASKILEQQIEIEVTAKGGKIISNRKNFTDVIDLFFIFLMDEDKGDEDKNTNSIQLNEYWYKKFNKTISDIKDIEEI